MLPEAKIYDYNYLVDLAGVRLRGDFFAPQFQNVVAWQVGLLPLYDLLLFIPSSHT